MKTVPYWKPASVTMWPNWCISCLRGISIFIATECARVCACASSMVSLWLFGSRIWASVWHSCSFACRKKTERSKKFFLDLHAKENVTTMVNPKPCGHLCCCIIQGCEQVRLTSLPNVKHFFLWKYCVFWWVLNSFGTLSTLLNPGSARNLQRASWYFALIF